LSLLAGYQQQIAELEGTVTHLRQRVMDLNASVSELADSRGRLSDLFHNAPVGYVVHEHTGTIHDINRTGRALLGLEKGGAGNISLVQFLPKDQMPLWLDHVRRAQTSLRATSDLVLRERGGSFTPIQAVTLTFPGTTGTALKVFRTILIDISQRRAAETALAQTQQDYHRLIDTVEGIVWEADARTLEVNFVSGYAQRLLGYTIADWSRPAFWQNRIYVDDRERVENELVRAVANRQRLRIDYRVLNADRRVVWLRDNITTLEHGDRLRLLGVAVDVTEQHQAHEQLERNQELLEERVSERTAELRASIQDLESFSYSISHDLRAPLRAMLGFAEIALADGGDQLPEKVKDCLQRIIRGGVRADRLVQDVLAYSRVSREQFQLATVDLDTFVPGLLSQYPDSKLPAASVRVQRPLLPVRAHEALLAQGLTNLLGNAIKFVKPGTVPHIRMWTEPMNEHQCVRLWVEDNGIGIAPENLKRIFNIFERIHSDSKYPGTGIGLAIVRRAVERMGGSVGAESESGKGSRFWIQLHAA
jgi:PAS domain S-box-containing protein